MTPVEQSIPLTEADVTTLRAKRSRAMVMAPLSGVLGGIIFLIGIALILGGLFSLILIPIFLFSAVLGLKALASAFSFLNLSRDLGGGQKRLINAPIEDQNVDVQSGGKYTSATYNFWVKAGGRKLSVTEEQYYQLKKGEMIQAYITPRSGVVLGMSKGDVKPAAAVSQPTPGLPSATLVPPARPGGGLSKGAKWALIGGALIVCVIGVGVIAGATTLILGTRRPAINYQPPIAKGWNPVPTTPPAGYFPDKVGKSTLLGKKNSDDYGSHRRFWGFYSSTDRFPTDYSVEFYSDPTKNIQPADARHERILQSGAVEIGFFPAAEVVDLKIKTDATKIEVTFRNLADANEFVNNFDYRAINVTAPRLPVNISFPRPPNAGLADPKINAAARGVMLEILNVWFLAKKIKSTARENKLDPATINTGATVDEKMRDQIAAELKKEHGEAMKRYGFRQFVIGLSPYKL